MLTLITLFIGLLVAFSNKISVSKNYELRRPRTVIFGLVLIATTLITQMFTSTQSNPALYFVGALVVNIIVVFLLRQPKLVNAGETKNAPDKVISGITWAIVGIFVAALVLFGIVVLAS